MSLLELIIALVVVGVVLLLVNYIPMDAKIKRILNIAVVVFLIIWLVKMSGLLAIIANIRI